MGFLLKKDKASYKTFSPEKQESSETPRSPLGRRHSPDSFTSLERDPFAAPLGSPLPFNSQFASLSLHHHDRLRFMGFAPSVLEGVRSTIRATYSRGLQSERVYGGAHEFKVHGRPWYGQGSDAIQSRILVREVLAYLFTQGYILHITTDISKKPDDKDTLIFRKQQSPPPPSDWLAISFNRYDKIRLIGAEVQLIDGVRSVLKSSQILQEEYWKDVTSNAYEFKCKGYPWSPSGEATMATRMLLLRLFEALESQGWSMYASIDQNAAAGEHESETDSWYCVRNQAWEPGMPVFHR